MKVLAAILFRIEGDLEKFKNYEETEGENGNGWNYPTGENITR